ncbi:hypothetical protein I3760_11G065900 [Carya illinoinensis]|uniref:RING-type domain-containing protein n=1 Tax=Carya illinoinensis TaxID=32201 RepID=A0A922IY77_CARIL|nr:hypothetical protein I3760_11G065900 [Carya illinoinensis]KAG2679770.1 hypothetical protein I3760_11G065900 [Carya illinoinensis]KAG2679771.1 hypothetical protein I3760_11G065900 [Carya illinoinensis]KAG6687350.1 hypothetical protein I3842_11G066100 [Carya illinoinensis]KAG6687351.1 hypothetical protein I3842_11G066100 [Carya illinoinensis]
MGNKLGRRRQVVDEKYTKPQGLYNHKDVDHKKLRKLILESKLAPCYPGDEECICDLEECPICFLYYPSLNRSRCCMKSICTECFLQMKVPNSTRPTQCPFCKTANYAVEYRGVKTKEEKCLEQIEEQRVIEAKIRIRQQELQDEEERMLKRQEPSYLCGNVTPTEVECSSVTVPYSRSPVESEEIVASRDSSPSPMIQPSPLPRPAHRTNRDDDFDLDLEDIMVMEAIWLSIQNSRQRNPPYGDFHSEQYAIGGYVSPSMGPPAGSSSSPSGGLACAIAALAERQQIGGESSVNPDRSMSASNMLPQAGRFYNRVDRERDSYQTAECATESSTDGRMTLTRDDGECYGDRGSDVAVAGTSYASSDAAEDSSALPLPDEIEDNLQNATEPIVPESFEEQMMLAMAVSLAEAQAIASGPGVSWQS